MGAPKEIEAKITQKEMDIAASIQGNFDYYGKMANHVKEITGSDNLCLAIEPTLNCVGNGELLKQEYYKKI